MTEAFGNPSDPAILLIHGAGSTMLSWDDELCLRLAAAGRFVIRYDLREQPTLDAYVRDAIAILDAHLVPRAHVVGMSFGGAIAQRLALDHPRRVSALTLASATPGGPGHPTPDLPGPTRALPDPPQPDWNDRDAVVEYLVEAERPYAARFDEQAARELAERVFEHGLPAQGGDFEMGDPWRERLPAITAPTLVIHGTEDPVFPLDHGLALANEIPGASLLALKDTGHEYFPRATWDVVVPLLLRGHVGA